MSTANYFIDTSALFKRYIKENGTEVMDRLFGQKGAVIISNLTVIEFISNLRRMFDVGKVIDSNIFNDIKNEFFNDIADEKIKIEPASSIHIVVAVSMICERYITPIDSLQLATAKILREKYKNVVFVCSDRKLCDIADGMGVNVLRVE